VCSSDLHLQNQAGKQTEVIMGINNNEQMQGRAQVILIVTGLGGTPIEEVMPNIEQKQISPGDESISLNHDPSTGLLEEISDPRQMVFAGASTNLDLPAFMRRRARYNEIYSQVN
jgi:cell division GTPase FtsZ